MYRMRYYFRTHRWNQQRGPASVDHGLFTLQVLVRLLPPILSRTLWYDIVVQFAVPYQSNPIASWCQWIPCKLYNRIKKNQNQAHLWNLKHLIFKIKTNLWPLIRFVNVLRSFLSKISCSSRTAITCSGFDRFGTCKTDVNAGIISISSSTSLAFRKMGTQIIIFPIQTELWEWKLYSYIPSAACAQN